MVGTRIDQIFEDIVETIREPLLVLDSDLKVVTVSRSFYDFFKVKPEETVGQLIYDLGNKQWDIPKLRELLETILPQKTTFDNYEVEHVFATIGRRIMLLNARQIERGMKKERIILLAIEDITERKEAEVELSRYRQQLEKMVEEQTVKLEKGLKEVSCLYAVSKLVAEQDTSIEDALKTAVDLITQGFQYPDVACARITIGDKVFATADFRETPWSLSTDIHVSSPELLDRTGSLSVAGGRVPRYAVDVCYLKERPKRDEGPFIREERQLLGDIARQIGFMIERRRVMAEREKLEEKVRQSQKMEAIGTLAGGIAHDFNNILSAIFGYTELALMKIDTETEIKADLKEVLLGAKRAKDLVKQILAFSRQAKEEKLPVQMGLITKEALKLLRSSLPSTIGIRQNILSKSIVLSDPTQLHQIVMNLCTNAAHAMQANGGILEVTLTDAALDSYFCQSHPEIQPGAYLKLSVSDTGCGMTADVMNRIFDPFFTTKPKGEGTGLGLSVVHGIVKDCGGTITVYSEPGKGSTFNLYFPIIAVTADEKPEEHKIIPTGTERILVVDDEKAIIDITQKILKSLGYAIKARTSSLEALELFKAMPEKFDLVITDMTMPQMTGDTLARELMKIRPDLPVILCTGFSEKMTNEKAENIGIKAFLMKPLLMEEMAHTIRRVLDEIKG